MRIIETAKFLKIALQPDYSTNPPYPSVPSQRVFLLTPPDISAEPFGRKKPKKKLRKGKMCYQLGRNLPYVPKLPNGYL